jgi:uracil-DNA glycosylase
MTHDEILRAALAAKGLRYVGIRGNPHAPVCIVGEAPGKDEDRQCLSFVGASGLLLDRMVSESGFVPSEVWFTNPYKTRPPDNQLDLLATLQVELDLFTNQFFEELRTYKPTIIVTCGKTATRLLCPQTIPKIRSKSDEDKEGFGSWRGSLLQSAALNWPHYIIPMYHPAFVLRNYAEREICVMILQRAFEEFTHWKRFQLLNPLPKREIITNPSYEDCCTYLERCINSQSFISIDIELLKRRVPYTISFALNPWSSMSLSLWNYDASQLVSIWRLIDGILSSKQIIGQNFTSFDAHWLRVLGFSVNLRNVHDTLIRHHVLWPGLRHKLEFQCMQYTRQPFYKWEGKEWTVKSPIEDLMHYNALDSAITYEVFNAQEEEFNERAA